MRGVNKTQISKTKVAEKRLRGVSKVDGGGEKKRRYRPGVVACREIPRFQRATVHFFRRAPFKAMVDQKLTALAKKLGHDAPARTTMSAIETLRGYLQEWNTSVLKNAQDMAIYSRRQRVYPKDVAIAMSRAGGNNFMYTTSK